MTDEVKVGFQRGEQTTLPTTMTDGTFYVAKAADGKAYMYIGTEDGSKLTITSPNNTFYYEIQYADEQDNNNIISISCPGLILEKGVQITVKIRSPISVNKSYFCINSLYTIKLTHPSGKEKILPGNTCYTFVYDGSNLQLIESINEVNNGITLALEFGGSCNSLKYGKNWGDGYQVPVLLGNIDINDTYSGNPEQKSIKAIVDSDQPITASKMGELYAPGGFISINPNNTNWYSSLSDSILNFGDNDTSYNYSVQFYYDHDNWIFNFRQNDNPIMSYLCEEKFMEIYVPIHTTETMSCADELYVKGQRVPQVYYGTTAPSPSLGANGDIYIMYS